MFKTEDERTSVSMFESYKNCKRSLAAGTNFKEFKSDIKLTAIESIVITKYRKHIEAIGKLKEGKRALKTKKSTGKWLPFDWNSKNEESTATQEKRKPLLKLIQIHEDIAIIVSKKYTMRDIISEKIGVYQLIDHGYNMIDWFLLKATWKELLDNGLDPQCFEKYHLMLDISSMIDYYGINIKDIFVDLCDGSLDSMSCLRMNSKDMTKIGFIPSTATKLGITLKILKKSKMWPSLTVEDWTALGFV